MITTLDIKAFMEANPGLIYRKESTTHPGLFVLKYHRKVFFNNLWTPELEWCRGLIVDANWNLVVQPFKKIYNRFERGTDYDLEEDVLYYRKVNGFMAAVTYIPGRDDLIVSTTGSTDSDYVKLAADMLYKNKAGPQWVEYLKNVGGTGMGHMTMLFEICHPADPHIIKEEFGAYGLALHLRPDGWNKQDLNSMFFPELPSDMCRKLGVFHVPCEIGKFKEVVEKARVADHEGYVVYTQRYGWDNKALKIKSPQYLITKFFARKTEAKLQDLLTKPDWKDLGHVKVEEEYYDLIEHLRQNVDGFMAMDEQARVHFVRNWFENRMITQ